MPATALIDATGGRAVIREEGGKIYILDTDKPGVLQDGEGIHFGMLGMARLEARSAGDYPYTDTINYLNLVHRQHQALSLFLTTLDPQMPMDVRQEAMSDLEEFLADNQVYVWLEETFLKIKPPEEVDVANGPKEGRAGEILAKAVEKWQLA